MTGLALQTYEMARRSVLQTLRQPAMIIPPMIVPRMAIIRGSMSDVSCSVVDVTSSS